jgi:hypothetical protein
MRCFKIPIVNCLFVLHTSRKYGTFVHEHEIREYIKSNCNSMVNVNKIKKILRRTLRKNFIRSLSVWNIPFVDKKPSLDHASFRGFHVLNIVDIIHYR